jgi:hypothetical protein
MPPRRPRALVGVSASCLTNSPRSSASPCPRSRSSARSRSSIRSGTCYSSPSASASCLCSSSPSSTTAPRASSSSRSTRSASRAWWLKRRRSVSLPRLPHDPEDHGRRSWHAGPARRASRCASRPIWPRRPRRWCCASVRRPETPRASFRTLRGPGTGRSGVELVNHGECSRRAHAPPSTGTCARPGDDTWIPCAPRNHASMPLIGSLASYARILRALYRLASILLQLGPAGC